LEATCRVAFAIAKEKKPHINGTPVLFKLLLLQAYLSQMFVLLMEPYVMIQVSILLQRQKAVVANFAQAILV